MSNVIASATYKSTTDAGVVIIRQGSKFAVGNWTTIPGIGLRYIIRSQHATEAEARTRANRNWINEHWA
jgi:hypothetical protein